MCEYCQGEGCICGNDPEAKYQAPCQCNVIGIQKCSTCGCDAQPWWADLQLPGGDSIRDLLWDLNSDEGFFPASKDKIIQALSESDGGWLSKNLPNSSYKDTGEVVSALLQKSPPIEWQVQPTEIYWRYPGATTCAGQQLVVKEDQKAVMMNKSGKACDEFVTGKYSLSSSNCPVLFANSRKVAPGFQHVVLDGFPVFVSTSKEFEVAIMAIGQSKSLRSVMANGIARVRISSPKEFLEQIGSKSNYNSSNGLSSLQKYSAELLKKEMLAHELDEISGNTALLESILSNGLRTIGLDPIKVNFSSVGDSGAGMFMAAATQMRNDPQFMEQMRQRAEAIRAAQMAREQTVQQQKSVAQSVACPSCSAPNPQTGKFCGNCGKPLPALKKTCPKCGQQSDPQIKFCGNCGTKL